MLLLHIKRGSHLGVDTLAEFHAAMGDGNSSSLMVDRNQTIVMAATPVHRIAHWDDTHASFTPPVRLVKLHNIFRPSVHGGGLQHLVKYRVHSAVLHDGTVSHTIPVFVEIEAFNFEWWFLQRFCDVLQNVLDEKDAFR